MVTIDEAEALVVAARSSGFPGTLMVSKVWEDQTYIAIAYGAREHLVDEDLGYLIVGARPDFVSKATGQIADPPGTEFIGDCMAYLATMTLVRDHVHSAQPV